MKKILLMALSVAAIVSCQKNVDSPSEPKTIPGEPNVNAPLFLSAGGNLRTKTGGAGIRNYKFEKDDVIGVFAAMGKLEATAAVADWANIYFSNKPATFQEGADPLTDSLTFAWGTPGDIGTLKNNQFYPAKDRSIFVYAYYPYSAQADSIKLSDVCTATGISVPTRFFSLVEGVVGEATTPTDVKTYVNRTQPDYMWAVGKSMSGADLGVGSVPTALDSVRRTLRLDTMTFKHALAQLNFGVYLSDENATACHFDSIRLVVPKHGAYDLIAGGTKIVVASPSVATDSVKYDITACNGEKIDPLPVGVTTPSPTNVLNILKTYPLMVMPMTAADLRGCRIEIVVNYGEVLTPDKKVYVLNLKDQVSILPINKGKYNTIYLGIGQTEIKLYCGVEPWKENDPSENNIIPVE